MHSRLRRSKSQPRSFTSLSFPSRIIDVFTKRKVSDGCSVVIVTNHGLKDLVREKRDRRTNMWKTTMRRHEVKTVADAIAKNTEYPNAHSILEVLFP